MRRDRSKWKEGLYIAFVLGCAVGAGVAFAYVIWLYVTGVL